VSNNGQILFAEIQFCKNRKMIGTETAHPTFGDRGMFQNFNIFGNKDEIDGVI
jgi:hypothetical protein